jgi:tetratricopeptide (TPR) repeat protein
MNEAPKTNRAWGFVRRILIAVAVLGTLVAIFFTEEDWRGKRAWESYKHEMEAKGENFDWRAFAPSAVPGDQNFFKAPIFKTLTAGGWDMTTYEWKPNTNMADHLSMSIYGNDDSVALPAGGGYWWKGTAINLADWQRYYRALAAKSKAFPTAPQAQTPAADVLLALGKYDSTIEGLRTAGHRPESRLPLDYDQGIYVTSSELLPWLETLKRSIQVLQLRSIAELQNGESEKALEDIELMFRINDSIRNQPFLIAHLVRMAVFSIAMQPIWEGLVQHRWTDEQLARLDEVLEKTDFLQDYEFAMRAETAFAIETIENERVTRQIKYVEDSREGAPKVVTIHFQLTPSAYFYRSELVHAQMSQQWAVPLVDTNRRIVSPESLQRTQNEIDAQTNHLSSYNAEALMTARTLIASARRFVIAQTGVDLGRVACALERYRLAHGQYPETLEALAPRFMESFPHDIINGQPLHYRRTSSGKFLLYSVGWNETDDGGRVVLSKNGNVDYFKGDWVWQSVN